MTSIVDLPSEVLGSVGDYLDNRAILNAALTCRLFHQHFSHLLWRRLSHDPVRKMPSVDHLIVYAEWVRILEYGPLPSSKYYDITFPCLRTLRRFEYKPEND